MICKIFNTAAHMIT